MKTISENEMTSVVVNNLLNSFDMETTVKFQVCESESKVLKCGTRVYRIYAEMEFKAADGSTVKKGTRGGWVESEKNLSQDGNGWIADDAVVYGDATVLNNALVDANACVHDSAEIIGSKEFGPESFAYVTGNAEVFERAIINSAVIAENAKVYGFSFIGANANVYGNARVYGMACVGDLAIILGNSQICDEAGVYHARVFGTSKIYGNAMVLSAISLRDVVMSKGIIREKF